jgi:DNA-nicking Smr family endonuclease
MARSNNMRTAAKGTLAGQSTLAATKRATQHADDGGLFRDAVRGITPLASTDRVPLGRQAPPSIAIQAAIDDFDPIDELRNATSTAEPSIDVAEATSFIRTGYSPLIVRRLRRGEWGPFDELDLHGATQVEARELLGNFLRRAVRGHRHCVRIIHGKGHGSVNRVPVLKTKVKGWLTMQDEVIAYCEAPPAMGGSGALLVLLKR